MSAPLTIELVAGEPIGTLADKLDQLAAVDGRAEIRRAARSLRQNLAGPPLKNDGARIEAAWTAFIGGECRTLWEAQLQAAGGKRSVAERLRRKMKADPSTNGLSG